LGDLLSDQASTLQKELDNGTANYILALANHAHWKRELSCEATKLNADTSIQYALSKKHNNPLWSSSLFFEQFSIEGHNLHPSSKTKSGMKPKDVFSYSPEFRQSQFICFLAVRKDYLLSTEIYPDYIESEFPEMKELYLMQMNEKGYKVEDYRLLPVHEWQYHNVIPTLYAEEIKTGIIILFTGLAIEGAASSSFRTIWPKVFGKPALKLAVNSQMTSTIRSISPQTAMNSVEFTGMMQTIMSREPSLKSFLPINEVAGYSFRSESKDRSRNLTVVARENFENKLDHGEVAIPGCSLYNVSPISGKTVIAEILDEYCRDRNFLKADGATSFLTEYLSTVIPGYLTLLVKYGVALEGHLQNSVPVFKDGKLVRFYFRDWGGARIYEGRLNQQGIEINFYPDSVSITSDEQEMREKAFYTVFQNHLGELIMQLCQYSGIQEKKLWKKVREACEKVFSELLDQGFECASRDAASLFAPYVKHKALTRMRLYPERGYCCSSVPNPLATEGN
jgi:siderophore synthetase component